MGKSKDKASSKGSAEPSFEFDLDFADGGQRNILEDDDVDNFLSNSGHEPSQYMSLKGGSTHSKKKGRKDYIDAGPDDRSTRSGKIKKKKKSKSTSALGESVGSFDDMSVRKKRSKRKKKKKDGEEDDDDDKSVGSMRSTRSRKSVRKSKSKSKLTLIEDETSMKDKKQIGDLEIENAALLEETAAVRRQLNDAEKALKKALSEQNQQHANIDLQRELEEYESAVLEKDELIQKLTDAVDTQLDKVEVLQGKLVRTEDEFCKMEEEMKDMEFLIDDLRGRPPSQVNLYSDHDGKSPSGEGKSLDEEILDQLDQREREIEKREKELLEKEDLILDRENSIKQQEDELVKKRSSFLKPQKSFESVKRDTPSDVDALEAKIKHLELENNDLAEEIEVLRQDDNGNAVNDSPPHQNGTELRSLKAKLTDSNEENELLRQELDGFKHLSNINEEERESQRNDFEQKLADTTLENEILRKELNGFKERKTSEFETLRQQIKELKMQKNHAEASSRQMRRMESLRMMEEPESTRIIEVEGEEEFGLEVEVEIAELREKIVEQEATSLKLKQEIGSYINENEDLKQDLEERDLEMKNLEGQLSATKETSAKKMKQKDETITFMQNTMMQIMQEKQEVDKKLRGNKLDRTTTKLMNRKAEDEAEKAKLEAINAELRKLDDENCRLEEELNQFKYDSGLKLKEKESAVLELQEELSEVKWELGAREKGADYITLLKDTKERKNALKKARRDLKEAEDKILELELQNKDILSGKNDLEKEIDALNKGEGGAEQISGLKRQIKSLKQHNSSLEQKLETQSRDSEDILVEKEAKIQILQFEMHKLQDTPAKTAIRGAVSGFITGFGRRNDENDMNNGHANNGSTGMDQGSNSMRSGNVDSAARENGKGGNLWGGLFGQRNQTASNSAMPGIAGGGYGGNGREGFDDNEAF